MAGLMALSLHNIYVYFSRREFRCPNALDWALKVLGAGFFGLPIIIVAETPSSPYQRLGIWETLNGYLRY